jgi:hypothetical protein
MQKKYKFLIQLFLIIFSINEMQAVSNYEAYLESWDQNWQTALQGLPPGPNGSSSETYQGVTLDIGFAAYLFTAPSGYPANSANLYGFQFQNFSDVASIIQYVQTQKGKAKISFGGASYATPFYPNYFISQTTAAGGWPKNIDYLAQNVAQVITFNYGTENNPLILNGVDFDLEDPQPSTINNFSYSPNDFATDLMTFLTKVRQLIGSDQVLSITIPAQGWGQYWQYLAQKANTATTIVNGNTVPVVDYINFMEYDIWVNQEIDAPNQEDRYAKQILADLVTYTSSPSASPPPNWAQGWGINPEKIQLGLMPANDDTGQNLTVANAGKLASITTTDEFGKPLYGVMIWDLDRDALTDLNPNSPTNPTTLPPTPYTFSQAIREALINPGSPNKFLRFIHLTAKKKARHQFTAPSKSQRHFPPLHGAP